MDGIDQYSIIYTEVAIEDIQGLHTCRLHEGPGFVGAPFRARIKI